MHSFVTTTSRKRLIYIILKYLFFANSQDVQIILDAINTHDRVAGLKINKDESKLLVVFRKDPEHITLHVDGKPIDCLSTDISDTLVI